VADCMNRETPEDFLLFFYRNITEQVSVSWILSKSHSRGKSFTTE